MRWAVCREKLGGCLSSARAGWRSPRGYIAKRRFCIPCVRTTHATSLTRFHASWTSRLSTGHGVIKRFRAVWLDDPEQQVAHQTDGDGLDLVGGRRLMPVKDECWVRH
eukprot:335127-Prymnesium_polylepis.2